ncbi:MAG: 5-formyltetrahydrofolate cyclo-ligase [Verrucomicrobia bacterium]|nr:MAG: 5-formyltetrahydrofolate cyclo-ligase [Verrucomicrobiota bacterium]
MTDPRENPADAKRHLRRLMRERRRQWAASPERAGDSARLCATIRASAPWQAAATVLLFAPMPDEPNLWPLLEEVLASGRRLCLPRFDPALGAYTVAEVRNLRTDLRPGLLNIPEPAPHCPLFARNHLDLIVLPGLAFDQDGRRLGRGKGYYDRLLSGWTGGRCGVAMDWQIVPAIPAEDHDKNVNWIATPTRWLTARRVQEA